MKPVEGTVSRFIAVLFEGRLHNEILALVYRILGVGVGNIESAACDNEQFKVEQLSG